MGAFILGVIVGAVGALVFFIYDEGELFNQTNGGTLQAIVVGGKQSRVIT